MRWYHFVVGVIVGAACLAALIAKSTALVSTFPPCPFWSLTGKFCPGCGTTRALLALLHGELFSAIAWNPLLVLIVPLPFLMNRKNLSLRKWLGWGVLVTICAFAIARNLPWEPFASLAPGGLLRRGPTS